MFRYIYRRYTDIALSDNLTLIAFNNIINSTCFGAQPCCEIKEGRDSGVSKEREVSGTPV